MQGLETKGRAMAMFNHPHSAVYEAELARFGVTFCDDCEDCDRLVIAPKLLGYPQRVSAASVHSSPVRTLDFLYVGGILVGVSYSMLASLIVHYLNGKVPDEFPMSYVTQLMLVCMNDPEGRGCYDETEFATAHTAYKGAGDFISSMPPIPSVIVNRMREYIAEHYIIEKSH